ncbi:MAG TPA: ABC transporter permease, partial [Anaerolineaceae bacterium]
MKAVSEPRSLPRVARVLPTASRALLNVGWRYLLARRWQTVLMVLGIALGVAVVVSIDLANASASRAFTLSTETVTGRATHQIVNSAQDVDEQVYVNLVRSGAVQAAAPLVSAYIISPQLGNRPMQLLGIDPFADAPFRRFMGGPGSQSISELEGLAAFFTRPGALLISQEVAARYGLKPGSSIELVVGGYRRQAFIAGLL